MADFLKNGSRHLNYERTERMRRILTEKASKGLEKLHSLLPLKSRQASLDEKGRSLYLTFLKTFVEKGRAMTRDEMKEYLQARVRRLM